MNLSNLFKAAHQLAKSVIQAGDNYRVTFGASLKMAYTQLENKTMLEMLLAAGAKVWEKGTLQRVYINQAIADVVFNNNLLKGFPVAVNIGKAKFYYDVKNDCLVADSGSIRSAINGTTFDHGFKCAK